MKRHLAVPLLVFLLAASTAATMAQTNPGSHGTRSEGEPVQPPETTGHGAPNAHGKSAPSETAKPEMGHDEGHESGVKPRTTAASGAKILFVFGVMNVGIIAVAAYLKFGRSTRKTQSKVGA